MKIITRQTWISDSAPGPVLFTGGSVSLSIRGGVKSCCPLLSHREYMHFLHSLFLAIMCKHDDIHRMKTTQCIAMPPKKDRATAIGNVHRKYGED